LEGADGNLLLEQGSCSRRGEAALTKLALKGQQAIRRRRTHGKQLPSALLRDVEVLMPLQDIDQGGQERDQTFGADAIGSVPDQEERVLDIFSGCDK